MKNPTGQRHEADPPIIIVADDDRTYRRRMFSEETPGRECLSLSIKTLPNEMFGGNTKSKLELSKSSGKLNELRIQDDASLQDFRSPGNLSPTTTKKPPKSVNFDSNNDHSMTETKNIHQTPRSISKIMSSMDPFGFGSRYGQRMYKMDTKNLNARYLTLKFPVNRN
jgi:hypothetical protein